MIKLYIYCSVLITGNVEVGADIGLKFHQETMEIVSCDSHFACFSIFSPKMRLRLTQNGQFYPIHNFSHLLPPKRLIFGQISKILFPGGRGTLANFLSFSTFLNCFTLNQLKMAHKANFATEVPWISTKWVILVKFQQKLKYLSGILTDLHQTFRTGLVFQSWSK